MRDALLESDHCAMGSFMKTAMTFAFLAAMPCCAHSAIIHVPADQPTIQAGIDVAAESDTVLIATGTYAGNIIVDKPLILLGEDRDVTVLDGGGSGDVISVTANRVHIANLMVQNAGFVWEDDYDYDSGIQFNLCDSGSVVNCVFIYNPAASISMHGSQFNRIEGCYIYGGRAGIYFFEGTVDPFRQNLQNEISICTIQDAESYGIRFAHTVAYHHQGNKIFGNVVVNCAVGLGAIMWNENVASYNDFINGSVGVNISACMGGGNSNLCHHNNFTNCSASDWDDVYMPTEDFWNLTDPALGNYWTEYAEVDNNGDGIGDSPHPIDGNAGTFDYYPLMQPVTLPTNCVGIRGNIDGDQAEEINVADLVYLVTYMFQDGPEPPSPEEADINGDFTGPDIADLVYLATYMFQNGPPPVACP